MIDEQIGKKEKKKRSETHIWEKQRFDAEKGLWVKVRVNYTVK